jgi:hypothetical protein
MPGQICIYHHRVSEPIDRQTHVAETARECVNSQALDFPKGGNEKMVVCLFRQGKTRRFIPPLHPLVYK